MSTKKVRQLLATVLSLVMILSLVVVPAGAAVPMGGEAVAETPADAGTAASGLAETTTPDAGGTDAGTDPADPGTGAGTDLTGAVGDVWTFEDLAGTQDTNNGAAAWSFKGLQFSIGTKAHTGAYIDMAANDCTITVPVAGKCNVEVTVQYGTKGGGTLEGIALGGGSAANDVTTYCYASESAGTVTIQRTTGTVYVKKIEIKTYDDSLKGNVGDKWDFQNDADFTDDYATNATTPKTNFKGAVFSGTAGKEADQKDGEGNITARKNHVVMQNGGKVAVPVAGNCDVEVTFFYAVNATVGTGENAVTVTDASTPATYHHNGGAGNVDITAAGTSYIHAIEIKAYTDPAPAITVDPATATVSMASKTDTTVTAQSAEVAINYANIEVAAIGEVTATVPEADADVVTAAVSADKTKVTLTPGTKAGKTTVTVTATPTDTNVAALTAEIAVTNVDPDVAPTEWTFGGDGHSADTFEADARGLKIPSTKSVKWHNNYGLLAKPITDSATQEVTPAIIGIPVSGPSKVTVIVGYSWDIMLGDAQSPDRYGHETTAPNGGNEQAKVFNYYGSEGYVTLTAAGAYDTYIYGIKVEELTADDNVAAAPKVAVWDLFGNQLDETMFDNRLDVETIKGFYGDPLPKPPTLGSFATADNEFAFVADPKGDGVRTDYRLRSDKEELTGFVHSTNNYTKNNVAEGDDPYDPTLTNYHGSFQSNGGKMTFKFQATAGDKLTFTYADASTSGAEVNMNFIDAGAAEGTVTKTLGKVGEGNGSVASVYVATTGVQTFTNALKEDGTWSKVGVARFYRETPTKVTLSGNLTVASDVPDTYKLIVTDNESGAVYEADTTTEAGKWSAEVNNYLSGASFTLSVTDAEGCIVGSGAEVTIPAGIKTATNDVAIIKVDLANVSGAVTGLEAADLANLVIDVTIPSDKVYVPKIIPNADGTYTTQLEKGVAYTLTAKNVNDYDLTTTSLQKDADATDVAIAFTKKATQDVTVTTTPADVDLTAAKFTFTRLDDSAKGKPEVDDKHPDGYVYTFTGATGIKLRDGQYKVKLDGAPLPNKLIADVKVNGAAATLPITFVEETPTKWDLRTADADAMAVAATGLTLENVKWHSANYGSQTKGGTYKIPVSGPCTINVAVGYNWDVYMPEAVDHNSAETSYKDKTNSGDITVTFQYTGAAGVVTLATGTEFTSYVKSIEVLNVTPYAATITVGAGKNYQTIQAAVDAAAKMDRPNGERVTIVIDPGNYEEMVWVKTPNITFKNASATPSIALTNQGKDIDTANAVRITWYYGCGFDYYSMGANSKFDAEQLAVNKANGYVSHPNSSGGGSNNECWWNATTVIAAEGFRAEGIIFENSFNQYVSAAAANDVIVPNAGAKQDDTNPRAELAQGSTEVQRKAYVERAAAIALANNAADKAFFDNCAFVGHQDVIYGGRAVNAGFYDCDVFGACDYVFGPMTAVFAKCDMVLNVGADADVNDVAYITAPQNGAGVHGYLMYNCNVRTVVPGTENAGSAKTAVQHGLGRAWGGATAEAVFYETTVGTNEGGKSLISPEGWNTGLGSSQLCAEYHTHETAADADHTKRIFGGFLESPKTTAGAPLADYAGWMGGWDPFEGKDMAVECPDYTDKVTGITLKDGENAAEASYELNVRDTKTLTVAVEPTTANPDYIVSGATEAVTITKGEGNTFTITAKAATEEDKPVVLTVKSVAAKADGTVATSTPVSLTINAVPVTGVTVKDADNATAKEFFVGTEQTVQLTATVAPENATELGVTWASDNEKVTVEPSADDPNVATVKVAADAAPATVKITATTKEAGSTVAPAEYTITLKPVLVTGVTVKDDADATSKELFVGTEQTIQLTATVAPENATEKGVTWASDNAKVTVSETGLVTVAADAAPGTVKITATTKETGSTVAAAEYTITLKPVLVTGITVTGPEGATASEVVIGAEQTVQLTATVAPENATEKGVTWTSDNEKVTVSETGLVTVAADAEVGTATITATTKEAGSTVAAATYVITLRVAYKPVETVTVTAPAAEVAQGGTVQLTAKVEPEGADPKVTWTSSDETGKVTVDETGKVTVAADAPTGKVTITAASAGETPVTGTIELTVVSPADALAAAIKAAQAELDNTLVSTDGADVSKSDVWTTQPVRDVMQAALDAAKAVAEQTDPAATADELIAATDTLNDAVKAFVDAQADGTKPNRRPSGVGTTTRPNTTKTETSTNDKGDVATTTTKPDGDKEITVVNKDGETVAEIKLPATIPTPATKFKDVPEGHWAEEAINHMAGLGMVKGVNEAQDLFDMESTMTRASIATMFFRLSNGKTGIASTFEDVAADQWYTDAIGWAAKTGVVTGYSETAFGPDDTITRQQLAVMLQRYANLIGMDAKAHASALDPFVDGDEAGDWAVEGLAWCVKNGIMKGRGGDVLDPTAEITRTEATAMFDRMIAMMQK